MLKNGTASVISSSVSVGGGESFIRGGHLNKGAFIRGGRLNIGTFIDGFYLLGGVHSRRRLYGN